MSFILLKKMFWNKLIQHKEIHKLHLDVIIICLQYRGIHLDSKLHSSMDCKDIT